MKKLFKLFATCFVCFCIMFTGGMLAGCGKNASARLKTVKDMYGFASMTSAVLLQNYESATAQSVAPQSLSYADIVDAVDGNIEVFESIVGGKKPVNTRFVESDNLDYAKKLVVNVNDITGDSTDLNFYFNETRLAGGQVLNDNPDSNKFSTKITGIITMDGIAETISVSGQKLVEHDETEISIRFVHGEYSVEYTQETEDDEQEFAYAIYYGGTCVKNFEFEMEVERNEVEVEYHLEHGGQVYSFGVEQKTLNGIKILEVSGYIGNSYYEILVIVENDNGTITNTYRFPDGTSIKKVRR